MKINSHEPLKNIYYIVQVIEMCMLQTTIQKLLSKHNDNIEADYITISHKMKTPDSVKYSIKCVMKPRQQQPTLFWTDIQCQLQKNSKLVNIPLSH